MIDTNLQNLKNTIQNCKKCPLKDGRKQVVFGCGPSDAPIMIIGEAPGKNEDEQGFPFVGRAGKILDEFLSVAGLCRNDVFITNVVKCRPPSNRNPRAEEILACTPYLRKQTAIIKPKVLITLGNFSTRFILKTEEGISILHGKSKRIGDFIVFPVYHPAATIYDNKKKNECVKDFKTLSALLKKLKSEVL